MPATQEKRSLIAFVCLFNLVWVGCASVERRADLPKMESMQQRVAELELELERQRSEMNKMTAEREAQENEPVSVPLTERLPQVPLQKLTPPTIESALEQELQGEVVVDSSHQAMHWYYVGLQYLKNREPEQAIRAFQQFLREEPQHIYEDRTWHNIAKAYEQAKEFGLVLITVQTIENRFPESLVLPECLLIKANALAQMGQSRSSRETLQGILKRFPGTVSAQAAASRMDPPKLLQ